MSMRNKALLSAVVVTALGSLAAFGIFGLFSSTTQNSGNQITTGTVTIADNDSGSALVNDLNAKPGQTWSKCIQVTYTGSLPADVKLYETRSGGALDSSLNVKIEQGTPASTGAANCSGFTAVAGSPLVNQTATGVPTSWGTAVTLPGPGGPTWTTNDSVVYKYTASVDPALTIQNQTTGGTTVNWEARNAS